MRKKKDGLPRRGAPRNDKQCPLTLTLSIQGRGENDRFPILWE